MKSSCLSILTALLLLQVLLFENPVSAQNPGGDYKGTLQDTLVLNTSVISASSPTRRLREAQIGIERISVDQIARMPAFMGERDIIKSLQLLPGVKEASQGSSGFQVRGGTTSQNLILLDGAPVYNAGHMMGLFSTFNDDALMDATLYKGLVPSGFGGAISSVFDISTRPGMFSQDKRFTGSASVGLLSAKASIGGPIVPGKVAFNLSARRTYFDLFLKLTNKYKNTVMNFYDVNGRIDWNISSKDRLSLSAFSANDKMALDDLADMDFGNKTITLKWSRQWNDKLRSNIYVYACGFESVNKFDILEQSLTYTGYIRQGGLSAKWVWKPSSLVSIDFGVQPALYRICTGEWVYNLFPETEIRNAFDSSEWVDAQWHLGENLTVSTGVRFDLFSALGGSPYYDIDEYGDIVHTYEYPKSHFVKPRLVAEPRVSVNWTIDTSTSLKGGYSRTSQNIHALKNDGISLPFDRYTLSSNNIKPQIADQVSLGFMRILRGGDYDISIEGYYKDIKNVLDYKEGKYLSSEIELERIIKAGDGKAYGAEFSFRKNSGKFTGWIAYTLSWSKNKIEGVNGGRWYDAANDRRHDFTLVSMYDLGRGWDVSATWSYTTGQAMSAPSAKYTVDGHTWYYYAEKNGYRAPANHHLDLSATHTKKKSYGERQWAFSIYNVYDRRNPFVITFLDDDTKPSGTKTVMTSLFGLVPSVSYNIKF